MFFGLFSTVVLLLIQYGKKWPEKQPQKWPEIAWFPRGKTVRQSDQIRRDRYDFTL